MAETNFNLIHDGMEEELAEINKLEVGSEERLSAMRAMQIRYNLDLNEYELIAKLNDLEERRAMEHEKIELEQERLSFERERAALEEMDKAAQAKSDAKRFRISTALAAGGLGASILFAIIGFVTDNSENIRNNNRDRDRDRIFNIGDRLKEKLSR